MREGVATVLHSLSGERLVNVGPAMCTRGALWLPGCLYSVAVHTCDPEYARSDRFQAMRFAIGFFC